MSRKMGFPQWNEVENSMTNRRYRDRLHAQAADDGNDKEMKREFSGSDGYIQRQTITKDIIT